MSLPEPIAKSADALKDLFCSPEYPIWDEKYNVTGDLATLIEGKVIAKQVIERAKMGRLNYSWYVEENAQKVPHVDALVFEGKSWTWKELADIVDRFAVWFKSVGIKENDAASFMLTNTPAFIFAWLGLLKAGGSPNFIDFNLKGIGLQHVLGVRPANVILVDDHLAQTMKDVVPNLSFQPEHVYAYGPTNPSCPLPTIHIDKMPPSPYAVRCPTSRPDDICCIIYTSGTTGLPKGVRQTHLKFAGVAIYYGRVTQLRPGERTIISTPLYHGVGSAIAFGAVLQSASTAILLRKFSPKSFWNIAREAKATQSFYIGEIPRYLMNQPPSPLDKDHNIHAFHGVGMRPDIWIPFKKRFGISTVGELWSQTETVMSVMNLQKTAPDGSEPAANRITTMGPLGRRVARVKLVRKDPNGDGVYYNKDGLLEEVEVGEPGHFILETYETRQFIGNYYNNDEAAKKKLIVNPFGPNTGTYYTSGDLMKVDENHGWSFVDRAGDTFRWKSENIATSSVELVLSGYPGIQSSNVYGVKVPNQEDGRAGMALISIDESQFKLKDLAPYLFKNLSRYAVPLWLKVTKTDNIKASSLFKLLKVELVNSAMDPSKAEDGQEMYYLDEAAVEYKPWSVKLYKDLLDGTFRPGGSPSKAKL